MIASPFMALLLTAASVSASPVGLTSPTPMNKEGLEVIAAAFEGLPPVAGQKPCILTVASTGNFDYFELIWSMKMIGYLGPLPPVQETNPLKNDLGITNPNLVERIKKSLQSFAREYEGQPGPISYWDISEVKNILNMPSTDNQCSEVFSFSKPLISDEFAFVMVERKRDGQKGPEVANVVLQRSAKGWIAIAQHGY